MAIEIRESFQVQAPIDRVWRFVMDPEQVAACMPGAALEKVLDERNFEGSISVKLGAITTRYKGRIELTEVDERAHAVKMVAEGRETGGGVVRATFSSRLESLPDGRTQVVAEASIDVTGRIRQLGRGMIQGVSHQLFQQFVTRTRQRLEGPGAASEPEASAAEREPLRIGPLILRTLGSAIARFLRRLLGRPATREPRRPD